jgi:hypothetical protein
MNSLKVFVLLTTLLHVFSVYNFNIHLEESEELCLDEYFSDKTLVIYEVLAHNPNIHVSLYDPADAIVSQEVISYFYY